MCGRMSRFFSDAEVKRHKEFMIDKVEAEFGPSYNVAPSQEVPVIIRGSRILTTMKWGLIPKWAKDKKIGNRMINARAETIIDKPSFRKPFHNNRCLVLSSGFFEWDKERNPHLIQIDKQEIMAFAGLWDEWTDEKGKKIRSFTIITSNPNKFMKNIHHRMPIILNQEDYTTWLESDSEDELLELLKPKDIEGLKEIEVSKLVNSPKNNKKSILEPAKKFKKPKDLQLKL
jgi:putative SOS response-associated peptidase YedK